MTKHSAKVFDTSTLKGLKAAEAYKARLENKGYKVKVSLVGLNSVKIEGKEAN